MKNNRKAVAAAIGTALALGATSAIAAEARDMQGNKVMIEDATGFTYGGDGMGKYAGGKIATGVKDPAVCGTFGGASCSMKHLKGK